MTGFQSLAFRFVAAVLFAIATLTPGVALAQQPDLVSAGNRWTITAFNDESPVHDQWATQGLCFRSIGFFGTHQRYEWWSDTFPDWNGIASQEGNEVVLHGDYANDVGHDAVKFNVVSSTPRNVGAGHWVEWREDGKFGRTIGFANALLTRVGRCQMTLDEAKLLPFPRDQFGREIESPFALELFSTQPK
jgi:hypothetical protein